MSTTATWCTAAGNNSLVAVTPPGAADHVNHLVLVDHRFDLAFQLCGRPPPRHESRPQFQLGAPRPPLQFAACFLDAAACFARLAPVSARNAARSFSVTCSGSSCSYSTSVSPHQDQNTSQPPCCERSSGAQNAEWRSPRCGFSWARAQHRCLSHSRCSRLTGLVIAEPFISLHVHDHSGVAPEVD